MNESENRDEFLWFPDVYLLETLETMMILLDYMKEKNPVYEITPGPNMRLMIQNRNFIQSLISRITNKDINYHIKQTLRTIMQDGDKPVPNKHIPVTKEEKERFKDLFRALGHIYVTIEPFRGVEMITNCVFNERWKNESLYIVTQFTFLRDLVKYQHIYPENIENAGSYENMAYKYYDMIHETMAEAIREMITDF
jgi:hypothetical protein